MTERHARPKFATRALFTDLLFGVQVVAAGVFGVSMTVRLVSSQQGVNITWILYWLCFLLLNLVLTALAHVAQPSRVTLQAITSYAWWSIFAAASLFTFLVRSSPLWDGRDAVTTLGVAASE